eukprot:g11116.t1
MEVWSKAEAATQTTLLLVRPGKGPLLIKSAFPEDISLLAALIQRRHAPEPPAPLPAEETSPEVPASHAASELLTSAMQTRTTSHDADPRGRTERRMERTQQTERVISRSSDWSAQAVEELTLSRIASGSGPEAVKQRGNIFVCFSLLVNEAGNPEAQNVVEVKLSEVPEELHQQFPEPEEKEPKEPKAKPKAKAGYKGDAEVKEKETKKSKDKKKGKLEGLRVGESRVVIGQDAQDNWNILSAAKGKHWFFHLTDFPSCYVILECNDPTMEEKLECARLCRDNTKHKLSGAVKVDVTQCGNVKFDRKRDVVGYQFWTAEDMKHAGNILIASLGRQPENTLLHWAGSLLAWRNTFVSQAVSITGKALWCCGEELGEKAVYLSTLSLELWESLVPQAARAWLLSFERCNSGYELGMFHFISMDWTKAHEHLNCVYISVNSDKVFFPYRTLVTTQLAAVAFSLGEHEHGESLCKDLHAFVPSHQPNKRFASASDQNIA